MSTAAILLLFAALAAPALVAFLRQNISLPIGAFYGVLVMGLLAWHLGFSRLPTADELRKGGDGAVDRCEELLDAARRSGVIVKGSGAGPLVVDPALWQQLPKQVQTVITECNDRVPAPRPERVTKGA